MTSGMVLKCSSLQRSLVNGERFSRELKRNQRCFWPWRLLGDVFGVRLRCHTLVVKISDESFLAVEDVGYVGLGGGVFDT